MSPPHFGLNSFTKFLFARKLKSKFSRIIFGFLIKVLMHEMKMNPEIYTFIRLLLTLKLLVLLRSDCETFKKKNGCINVYIPYFFCFGYRLIKECLIRHQDWYLSCILQRGLTYSFRPFLQCTTLYLP